jgi:HPr kinase/phosphorylase
MKISKKKSLHGVFININNKGVLILGPAGIGKSSFALELLHLGHQLIADDIVDFQQQDNSLVGSCPSLSSGFLHCRELGLIAVKDVFNEQAFAQQHPLHYVVELKKNLNNEISLMPTQSFTLLGLNFPLLQLSVTSTASLSVRLLTWLTIQKSKQHAGEIFAHHQQQLLRSAR